MRPKQEPEQPQRELFQVDLEQLIDMSHPLVRLGLCIDWSSFKATMGATYHPSQGAWHLDSSVGSNPIGDAE
jgi:hypothetical protein